MVTNGDSAAGIVMQVVATGTQPSPAGDALARCHEAGADATAQEDPCAGPTLYERDSSASEAVTNDELAFSIQASYEG